MKTGKLLCAAAFLFAGIQAQAAVIDFDLSGPGGDQLYDSMTFNQNGYTLEVFANAWLDGEKIDADVTHFTQGIGVSSGIGDSYRLENTDYLQEQLMFVLSSDLYPEAKFSWASVDFGTKWSSRLEDDEMAQVRFGYPHNASFFGGGNGAFERALEGYSTLLDIKGGAGGADNGFRVQNVAFDVPAPATIGIFSMGVLAIGAGRLSRKKAAVEAEPVKA